MDAAMGANDDPRVDFLVVGSGIAGLRAAIELAPHGSVLILTKGDFTEGITRHAQGGMTVALGKAEDAAMHLNQTLRSGDGLCREEAVKILVEEGPRHIHQLGEWGAKLELKPAASMSPRQLRVVRAVGNPVGVEILRVLTAKTKSLSSLRWKSGATIVNLLLDDGRVCGAMYLDEETGSFRRVRAEAVLLATGGLGEVYAETTNPPGASGDGVALAFRAGGLLADLEFVQFHPTVLYTAKTSRVALPSALCEQGARLRNLGLERFMPRYHEAGEHAPLDILTRAIVMEMQRGRSEFVYLDLTGLDAEDLKKRFPHIYTACLDNNIDMTSDLLPVRPAAHFAMGGIATDLDGATSVDGLYAAGEAAATGVHGANRLANNALLEALVWAVRAAQTMSAGRGHARFPPAPSKAAKPEESQPPPASPGTTDLDALIREIRASMWVTAGVIRQGSKLKEVAARLRSVSLPQPSRPRRSYYETANLLEVARLLTSCSEARKESRGSHYREDFPLRNDSEFAKHSYVSKHSSVYFA